MLASSVFATASAEYFLVLAEETVSFGISVGLRRLLLEPVE
jgi:hypothetical protein